MSLAFMLKRTEEVTGSNVERKLVQLAAAECLKQRDAETVHMHSITNSR
jgi:hypothetical protein